MATESSCSYSTYNPSPHSQLNYETLKCYSITPLPPFLSIPPSLLFFPAFFPLLPPLLPHTPPPTNHCSVFTAGLTALSLKKTSNTPVAEPVGGALAPGEHLAVEKDEYPTHLTVSRLCFYFIILEILDQLSIVLLLFASLLFPPSLPPSFVSSFIPFHPKVHRTPN